MRDWEEFLKSQESLLGEKTVSKWLRSLKITRFDACNLYLEAKDSFHVAWFEEHIRPLLKSFKNNNYKTIKVHLLINDQKAKKNSGFKPDIKEIISDSLEPYCDFSHFITTKQNVVPLKLLCELSGYNLDSNQLEKPKLISFNPIFLYGAKGSGKTHLLMATTKVLIKQGLRVLYVSSNTFTQHVVSAIRNTMMEVFRKKYRNIDVLILDDIHNFSKKTATQEEFFHTFNFLHTANKQIIISSSTPPQELSQIEPRLISRFVWGFSCSLEKLELNQLPHLLEKKLDFYHLKLSKIAKEYLIQTFKKPKTLQRSLETLILRKPEQKKFELDEMKHLLQDLVEQEKKLEITPDVIIKKVAHYFGLKTEDLYGTSQTRECAHPRQISMYFIRKLLRFSFPKIGKIFSRDHSTVMTSIKQVENNTKNDIQLILKKLESLLD